MKLSRERYDDVFPGEASDLEVAAAWRRLRQTGASPDAPGKPRWVWWWVAAAALVGSVGSLLIVGRGSSVESSPAPAAMPPEEHRLLLPDGSWVTTTAATELSVARADPRHVALRLLRGQAEFTVVRAPERPFVVAVGELEIRVMGTQFRVDTDGQRVRVEVIAGEVEVLHAGGTRARLRGGEDWSGALHASAPAPSPRTSEPTAATSAGALPSALPAPPSAAALLERALRSRRAGHTREALAAFAELDRRYPSDPRADLARLEVARIRLDELDDPHGALRALEAPSATPNSTDEDAAARRVESLHRLGDHARCRAARADYLARYPTGTHAAVVRERCGRGE